MFEGVENLRRLAARASKLCDVLERPVDTASDETSIAKVHKLKAEVAAVRGALDLLPHGFMKGQEAGGRRMMSHSNANEPYMTVVEAAEHLRVSKQTIYNKVSLGEMPHYKRGGLLRFKKSELDAWLRGEDAVTVPPDEPDQEEG